MRARLLVLAVFAAIVAVWAIGARSKTSKAPLAAPSSSVATEPARASAIAWTAPPRVKVEGWVVDEGKLAVVGARVCAVSISL
ncbi:MAG: hypothetical protein ACXVEE_20450 [Polyangiales bacterium]